MQFPVVNVSMFRISLDISFVIILEELLFGCLSTSGHGVIWILIFITALWPGEGPRTWVATQRADVSVTCSSVTSRSFSCWIGPICQSVLVWGHGNDIVWVERLGDVCVLLSSRGVEELNVGG